MIGRRHSAETKAKMSASAKGRIISLEQRAKISASLKGSKHPMYGKVGYWKGKVGPMKGKHHSQETIAKISDAKKGKIGPWKGKMLSVDHRAKLSIARRKRHASTKSRIKNGITHKRINAENPSWREARMSKVLASGRRHPNNLEKQLTTFISAHELPYKYTGNGSSWINHQNPDFINVNGQKVVIELNGCYWHGCKVCGFGDTTSEVDRLRKYAEFGFKTIEIWEHDMTDEQTLLQLMGV